MERTYKSLDILSLVLIFFLIGCEENSLEMVLTENSQFKSRESSLDCSRSEAGEYLKSVYMVPKAFDNLEYYPKIDGSTISYPVNYEISEDLVVTIARFENTLSDGSSPVITELWSVEGKIDKDGNLVFEGLCDSDLVFDYFAELIVNDN